MWPDRNRMPLTPPPHWLSVAEYVRRLLLGVRIYGSMALLFCLSVSGAAIAMPDEYVMRDWHTHDGLPSEDVSRVLQAHDGFLWILTNSGLCRFDGMLFETVPLAAPDGRSIPLVRALVETPLFGIVVAPQSGGLLAARERTFSAVPMPPAARERVYQVLFSDAEGALWGGSDDGLVSRITQADFQTFQTRDDLNGRPAIFFASDGAKGCWVSNGTNLYRFERDHLQQVNLPWDRSELRIGSSRNDGPWLVAHDRLLKLENDLPVEKFTLPPFVAAHYIQAMLEDRQGRLWFATRSQGVYVFAQGKLTRVPTTEDEVLSFAEDTEGNVWAALNGGGLNRLHPKVFRLFNKSVGLPANFSATVCEDLGGTMWFANRDGGVARLQADGSVHMVPAPAGWPVISIVALAPRLEGGVWATAGPGIFAVAEHASPVMERLTQPRLPIIRCLYRSRSNALWFSMDPDQLGRMQDGKFSFFGPSSGLDGRQVRSITEDAAGRIWCGTADGKLFRQDHDRFVRVPLDREPGAINSIIVDPDGTLWLGTFDCGVLVYRNSRWQAVDAAGGLPDSRITQLLDDDEGNIWLGAASGIFRVGRREIVNYLDQKTGSVQALTLGRDEGLKSLSCSGFYQPAAWKSRDGRLWFATRQGVLQIDPKFAQSQGTAPVARIIAVTTDDKVLPAGGDISVRSGFRKLEIRFSALCLSTPERIRLKYRLEGFDDNWVSATNAQNATYPRLLPGQYRFLLASSLAGSPDDFRMTSFEIVVVPLWWQTWWFRLTASAFTITMLVLWARNWGHRRLRRKLENLERQSAIERERTRISQNLHDELGSSLTRVSLLTQNAQHEAPEAAAHFERIYDSVVEITRTMDEIVWAANPRNDDLESLVDYLGSYSQKFLHTAGIRCRLDISTEMPAFELTSQIRHHLFLCCKEALNNVVKHAHADAVTLTVELKDATLTVSIADNGRQQQPAPNALTDRTERISGGNGLANMRHRMEAVGGSCEVTQESGGGWCLRFSVPLDRVVT